MGGIIKCDMNSLYLDEATAFAKAVPVTTTRTAVPSKVAPMTCTVLTHNQLP